MQILRPAANVYAFYEGRTGEERQGGETWVESGALSLGVASYALVDREQALVFDTHVSVDRAQRVRETLESEGVRKFTVLLSHWHLDHVAGTAAFEDCEILASRRTAELLRENRAAIEAGELEGPPPIAPLVMPTRLLEGRTVLAVGDLEVDVVPADIHSEDGLVLWLPERRLLLAADSVEDTITYVMEPTRLGVHLGQLERLAELRPERLLPSHGSPEAISAGGYSAGLIRATQDYLRALLEIREEPELRDTALRELLAGPLEAGWIIYYAPYEAVHQANLRSVIDDARP
jgi:cyclase